MSTAARASESPKEAGRESAKGAPPTSPASSDVGNANRASEPSTSDEMPGSEEEDEDESDEEDEEPWFKYQSVTQDIKAIYRNGDAISCFVPSGDKMVIGTHNGVIHVVLSHTLEVLRSYRAHKTSVTSLSVSPPQHAKIQTNSIPRQSLETLDEGSSVPDSASIFSARTTRTVNAPRANVYHSSSSSHPKATYVASSSVEGNVCVASLSDPKDVMLRNFGRPVHAVALSPNYKRDRTFLSGGTSGSLVLTVGGRIGGRSDATILGSASTRASGWLGSLGLAQSHGKDTVLHDGEGIINTIKWSHSGKFVVWVNEEGIKVLRSNLHLGSAEAEVAWTRISHIDRPRRSDWDDMAGVWKARAEWVSQDTMESNDEMATPGSTVTESTSQSNANTSTGTGEKLIVGWGGTIWVVDVFPAEYLDELPSHKKRGGTVKIATILRTDCIISGVSLYTPNLLLVLAHVEGEDDEDSDKSSSTKRPGFRRKQTGLRPELRMIDIETRQQIFADSQDVDRYQNLSASDYHLGVLPAPRTATATTQRSTLDTLWDATVVQPTRLISSAASIRSTFSGPQPEFQRRSTFAPTIASVAESDTSAKDAAASTPTGNIKIVIHSPYDCIVATRRGPADRLTWLEQRERYEEAWNLINEYPDAVSTSNDEDEGGTTPTRTATHTSLDVISEDAASVQESVRSSPAIIREKGRIGELWLNQLITESDWMTAGEVCGKVLRSEQQWEHWISRFTENGKYDEITPHIPANLASPLPSAVYEEILIHYVATDRYKLRELLEQWATTLFDVTSVVSAIEDKLPELEWNSDEWRMVIESLAQLYLASGRYREALRCYIQLGDAETTMALIKQYHLLEAIGEDIAALILLHVPKEMLHKASKEELEAATSDIISLLVSGARNGLIRPETVIDQLQNTEWSVFLYFYLKALWKPKQEDGDVRRGRFGYHHILEANAPSSPTGALRADEGRAVVEQFADTAVEVFANYDREMLRDLLQSSTAYSYSAASAICEKRHYTKELIFLLSKTGDTKRALNLILSDLGDVSEAISFAKQQEDPDLWEDLLAYSMDKPAFIRGLLTEAGTAIDSIALVRRIPSGLEIEGLRDGLTRLIREYDIQASISEGVARVLVGEVAARLESLRKERGRGIKINVKPRPRRRQSQYNQNAAYKGSLITPLKRASTLSFAAKALQTSATSAAPATNENVEEQKEDQSYSCCASCHAPFVEGQEKEALVAFGCGHMFHLSHLDLQPTPQSSQPSPQPDSSQESQGTQTPAQSDAGKTGTLQPQFPPMEVGEDEDLTYHRSIGPKVTTARLLRDRIESGCRICAISSSTLTK